MAGEDDTLDPEGEEYQLVSQEADDMMTIDGTVPRLLEYYNELELDEETQIAPLTRTELGELWFLGSRAWVNEVRARERSSWCLMLLCFTPLHCAVWLTHYLLCGAAVRAQPLYGHSDHSCCIHGCFCGNQPRSEST